MMGRPSGVIGRIPARAMTGVRGGVQLRKYVWGARRIASTWTGLTCSSRRPNSIVPARRRLRLSGVTATLASERFVALRRPSGSMSMLYPLPGRTGSGTPNRRDSPPVQAPAASRYAFADTTVQLQRRWLSGLRSARHGRPAPTRRARRARRPSRPDAGAAPRPARSDRRAAPSGRTDRPPRRRTAAVHGRERRRPREPTARARNASALREGEGVPRCVFALFARRGPAPLGPLRDFHGRIQHGRFSSL